MLRSLAFWIGFALALPQAIWVRNRAQRFADAAGEPHGLIPGPDSKRLIAIGDSIIAGVGCQTLERACVGQTAAALAVRLDRGIAWQAIGRTGATTGAIIKYLVPRLPEANADYFLISTGVNDITGLKTLRQWSTRLDALIEALRCHSPEASIALIGIPPMDCFPRLPQPLRALFGLRARSFDAAAARLIAPLERVVYVPFDGRFQREQFAADGYHPSEASCREIARQTVAKLEP